MPTLQNLQFLNPRANTEGDPYHEYLDIQVVNNSSNYVPKPIIFNQVKTSNIIDKCSDYYLSVIKWSFFSNLPQIIPLMQPPESLNAPYTGATQYALNIGYGSSKKTASFNIQTARLVYYTSDENITTPTYQPVNQQEVYNNPFFYLYSVESFLGLVNKSLESCFDGAKTLYSPLLDTALPPKFIWNTNTNKINLIVSKEFVEGITTNSFYISMNNPLYNLFDTFPSYVKIFKTSALSDNAIFSLNDNYGVSSFQDPDGTGQPITIYTFSQQSSSVVSWSPVNSIVFTTSRIPINSEESGAPEYLGNYISNTNAVANTTAILTDFTIPMIDGTEYTRNMLYYIPTSEYRLVDLLGDGPLKQLNIQVLWQDILGQLHQATLKHGCVASVKILLRKREFNGI